MRTLLPITFLCVLCAIVKAQTIIPVGHMPTIGDVFTYGVHNSLYVPKPLTAGVYDFSDLNQDDTTVFRYVANDKLVEFPNSNLKLVEDNNDPATVYFQKTGNDLFLISLAAVQSQIPIPGIGGLKGTMKYLNLPLNSSTNVTSTDEIATILPKSLFQGINIDSLASTLVPGATVDSLKLTIKFTLNLKVDGSGKIKTPIDSNINVLKVVRKITVNPSLALFGKVFGFPLSNFDVTSLLMSQFPISDLNVTTHTFYSPSFRQEIITATLDSLGNYSQVNYRYRTKNSVATNQIHAGTNSPTLAMEIRNGDVEIRNIQPHSCAQFLVYGLDGKKLFEKSICEENCNVPIDKWNGIRIFQLRTDSQLISKKVAFE